MAEQQPQSTVVDITERLETDHLAREHGLVPVKAFVKDPDAAKKRTGAADRMAKMRERQKEAGLVSTAIPADAAAAIKEKGWQAWLDAQRSAPPREVERVIEVEKPVEVIKETTKEVLKVERVEVPVEKRVEIIKEVPAKLQPEQLEALTLGRKVKQATGFKRWMLERLLG